MSLSSSPVDLYPFNYYARYVREHYGFRVQKITVDGGFTCPNRDGTAGVGGCTYCDNGSFSPTHQRGTTIREQVERAISLSKRRYKNVSHYIVYFQSYSNTYAPLERLKSLYEEALDHPQVIGLSIGTRPDCLEEETLHYLAELAGRTELTLELGAESVFDETLKRIGRGHSYQVFEDAVIKASSLGIDVCGHFILGFPWEMDKSWILTAQKISTLPLKFLKIHQLRVLRGTAMGRSYLSEPFKVFSMEEYAEASSEFLEYIRPDIIIQRLSGESQGDQQQVLAGSFPLALPEFTVYLAEKMRREGKYQGRLFHL